MAPMGPAPGRPAIAALRPVELGAATRGLGLIAGPRALSEGLLALLLPGGLRALLLPDPPYWL
jgi:hypothetical protein